MGVWPTKVGRRALAAVLVAAAASSARAQKASDDFKKPFGAVWKGRSFGSLFSDERGPVVTWAVLLHDDVTASSIYPRVRLLGGSAGNALKAGPRCYETAVEGGAAREPEPEKQKKDKLTSGLRRGEVLEVQAVSFRDDGVEFRLEAVAPRKFKRENKDGSVDTMTEPVCATLRFVLPFPRQQRLTERDAPAALDYVAAWLKPFTSVAEAQSYEKTLAQEMAKERLAAMESRCNAGKAAECATLAAAYQSGKTVAADPKQAAVFYQKACDLADLDACVDYGVRLVWPEAPFQDPKHAFALFTKACDAGHARGCANLALLYKAGVGAVRDLKRAAALFRKACDAGHAPACTALQDLSRPSTAAKH